jgi:hypothetical protein
MSRSAATRANNHLRPDAGPCSPPNGCATAPARHNLDEVAIAVVAQQPDTGHQRA